MPSRTIFDHLSDAEAGVVVEEMATTYERAMAPSRDQVIAKLVHYGCPRKAAVQQMAHPGLSLYARQFYVDAEDSEHGDPDAKKRVEDCREAWARLNRAAAQQAGDDVLK